MEGFGARGGEKEKNEGGIMLDGGWEERGLREEGCFGEIRRTNGKETRGKGKRGKHEI